jgi:hypothetical protein
MAGGTGRSSEVASGLLGSWPCLGAVLVFVAVGAVLTDLRDRGAGAIAVLDLIMPGLALAAVCVVLMAIRRVDRAAERRALHQREVVRQIQAIGEEILGDLDQMNSGLAGLAARIETINIRCRAAADTGRDERNRST